MRYRASLPRLYVLAPLALAVCAAGASAQIARAPNPAPRETIVPGGRVEVPMQRFRRLPVLEALINGRGPYRFAVDTGAPSLFVHEHVAQELKLPAPTGAGGPAVEIRVAGPGGQGLPATLHRVESLKIGNAEFRDVDAIVHASPMGMDLDGVIGVGVFRDCLLTFDYLAGKFRFEPGELPAANGRDVLDFTWRRPYNSPVIAAELNGQPLRLALDTGASSAFNFSAAALADCPYAFGPVAGPKARTVDREFDMQVARLGADLKVGAYNFTRPIGMVGGEVGGAVIGSGALGHFALTFDQKNNRLRLGRADTGPIVAPPFRDLGIGLRNEDGAYRVWYVREDAPAQRAGLKVGDTIVAAAGRPLAEFYGQLAWDKLLEQDAIRLRYRPADQSAEREVDVAVMELVP